MSKKDFIALADALRGLEVPAEVLAALMRFCKSRNGRFDGGRFCDYLAGKCGPSGGPVKKRQTA